MVHFPCGMAWTIIVVVLFSNPANMIQGTSSDEKTLSAAIREKRAQLVNIPRASSTFLKTDKMNLDSVDNNVAFRR
jgi:hypothetical protein